ncbi:putative nuclease HARBI1 [Ischnura elegans]|uniref:putative nuclease HARBI1 n=1 Tax=Ischnura elegans TaxID=197161 RepID=UPI001ED88A90|nr:putative nuclease HARBI1 [Ischnura elegans]
MRVGLGRTPGNLSKENDMNEEQFIDYVMEEVHSSSSSDDSESSVESGTQSESQESGDDVILEEELLFPVMNLIMNGQRLQRVHNFLEIANAKSDEEFKNDFRLQRRVVYKILDSLIASGYIPTHRDGKEKISAELSLLLTLWFLANNEPHRTLANLFNVSFSSVSRIVRRVVNWLVTLTPEVIKWPEGNQINKESAAFEALSGIRGCIGAIDGSHIPINQPENGRPYFNRKQAYSINLQGVVGSDLKFINIYCGDPGSYHDVRVLRRSDMYAAVEANVERYFPNQTFLLGDKAYNGVGKKWIVCPFKENGQLTDGQIDFNFRISQTRVVVERAFGILKGRFRRLQKIQLQDMEFTVKIVVACCVLHNICMDNGDDGEEMYENDAGMDHNGVSEDEETERERIRQTTDRREQLFRRMLY